MSFSFDLISDLHVDAGNKPIAWAGQSTAQICVVAGDIAQDRALVIDTLERLGEAYNVVLYIDGNTEHKNYYGRLGQSYQELKSMILSVPNVVFMQDNVVIVNGIAFLATNGWWGYDFDPAMQFEQSILWFEDKENISQYDALEIKAYAEHDVRYMVNSMRKLQTQNDVESIVLVSHTVPAPWLISHDIELTSTWRYNSMGNSQLASVLEQDTENKIKTWCFGHYHMPIDVVKDNIHYVSNPKGVDSTPYSQMSYYPKRVTVA